MLLLIISPRNLKLDFIFFVIRFCSLLKTIFFLNSTDWNVFFNKDYRDTKSFCFNLIKFCRTTTIIVAQFSDRKTATSNFWSPIHENRRKDTRNVDHPSLYLGKICEENTFVVGNLFILKSIEAITWKICAGLKVMVLLLNTKLSNSCFSYFFAWVLREIVEPNFCLPAVIPYGWWKYK